MKEHKDFTTISLSSWKRWLRLQDGYVAYNSFATDPEDSILIAFGSNSTCARPYSTWNGYACEDVIALIDEHNKPFESDFSTNVV